MLFKKHLITAATISVFLTGTAWEVQALDAGVETPVFDTELDLAAPESIPPEIAEMLGEMEMQGAGADLEVAPPDVPQDILQDILQETDDPEATAAAKRFLYTTLRVITNKSSRGCGYGNWNCMTKICKKDLRDNSAWRGWAGCWKKKGWICYFECGQSRNTF